MIDASNVPLIDKEKNVAIPSSFVGEFEESAADFLSPTFNSFKVAKDSFNMKENSYRNNLSDGKAHLSSFNAHISSLVNENKKMEQILPVASESLQFLSS